MANTWGFSTCERPDEPTTTKRVETIIVELRDNRLTISGLPGHRSDGRLHALRTVGLGVATTYVILSELPADVRDDRFFPASGTVVCFDPDASGRRRLSAVGTDRNSGRCRGWIFEAVET